MKQLLKQLTFALCLVTVVSCKKAVNDIATDPVVINPISDFTYTPDPTDAFTFKFTNKSLKFKKLEWRFGDDTLTTQDSPTHVYLGTGKFTVDLKTFSETGYTSRKLVDITLVPDSIMKVTPTKTGVTKEISLAITAKATIANAEWTFNDVNPAVVVKSVGLAPVKRVFQDGIQTFTVKATTNKGSVVSLTRTNITTEGYVEEITQSRSAFPTLTPASADNSGSTTENATKLFDGNGLTKMYKGGFKGLLPVSFDVPFATAQTIKYYAIGNSNDSPDRDPKTWTVEGSNDGTTWTVLDTRTMPKTFKDQRNALGFTEDNKSTLSAKGQWWSLFYYGISNPQPFKFYRWKITELWGSNDFQASEFKLYR